jgi:hypothetical protein
MSSKESADAGLRLGVGIKYPSPGALAQIARERAAATPGVPGAPFTSVY